MWEKEEKKDEKGIYFHELNQNVSAEWTSMFLQLFSKIKPIIWIFFFKN